MKAIKYISTFLIALFIFSNCEDDNEDYLIKIDDPTNVTALVTISQDNSGLVTIVPTGDGVSKYNIDFGDGSEKLLNISPGNYSNHIYKEGSYELILTALGLSGNEVSVTIPVTVSFNAPENLEVAIENDPLISKQVNVTATADFAMNYEVYFGEDMEAEPVVANIGEMASYTYTTAGTYTIKVVAMGGAIQTTEYTEEFEVTEILNPLESAPEQPARMESDYIAVYSDDYTVVDGSNYNPDWGQSSQGSSFEEFDLEGDKMLQYINLSYQGIELGANINASMQEFLHIDIWTTNVNSIDIYPLPEGIAAEDEKFVSKELVSQEWTSFDIPLSEFTDQGLTLDNLKQFKFVGTPWAEGTVFIDNIYFYKAPADCEAEVAENIDPSMGNINWTFMTADAAHAFEPFGNISSGIVPNPISDDINSSCNVQQYSKTAGCETWSGVGKALSNPIDLITNVDRIFTMKVLAEDHPTEVTLRLEFEPFPNVDPFAEAVQTISAVGVWEELTFDFSAHNDKTFKSIIVYFDRNNACDDAVYYFDDIVQSGGSTPPPMMGDIMDFEPGSSEFTWAGFGDANFAAIPASVIMNPDASGINTSMNVVEIEKTIGAQTWAGASTDLNGTADFSTATTIDVKVWSPRPNTPILFKMEDSTSPLDGNGNPTVFVEVIANSTMANTWETVSFDLTSDSSFSTSISYDRVILFPDFGNSGNGEKFYFDDITIMIDEGGATISTTQIDLPVDFESSTIDYTLTDFGDNISSIVVDPTSASNTVAQVIKPVVAPLWAGTTIGTEAGFASNIPISLTNSKMTVRVWSPDAGTPIRLKIEDANDPTHTCETEVNTTVAGGWETLEFDFTNQAPGTESLSVGLSNGWIYNKASIFFNFGTDGATAGEKTYYFDDVIFVQ
ncbi:hypothetical protein [Urechidicola vernalis]|uniref:PKD domain-containing protein n=1 Tax=Urechidicola vernalis TaxID=3075600 RepID=A0ABU2Y5E8_9FLAO|nr:hypothetical protein [Urechidicola sp. P050]MDT0553432.1 hypothetical protein [Urechidicola sp. P050]